MKKHSLKILSIFLLLITVISVSWYNSNLQKNGTEVLANNNSISEEQGITNNEDASDDDPYNLQELYNLGVSEGIIEPEYSPFDEWKKENEEDYIPCYEESINQGIFNELYGSESITYEEWLKINNYGVTPNMGVDPSTVEEDWVEPETSNPKAKVVYSGFELKKGDILITNSTSLGGLSGHAAIMNGSNHVLDMPGYGFPNSSINRQTTPFSEWMKKYKKAGKYVKVYRLRSSQSSLASQVGTYADRHYYSTSGTSNKNIHIAYTIGTLYTLTPQYHGLYCSQLVYLAYYYGTGSAPAMEKYSALHTVTPYGLPNTFKPNYKPTLVKQFNF